MSKVNSIISDLLLLSAVEVLELAERTNVSGSIILNMIEAAQQGQGLEYIVCADPTNPQAKRPISAIKLIREVRDMSLRDAKNIIDGITSMDVSSLSDEQRDNFILDLNDCGYIVKPVS